MDNTQALNILINASKIGQSKGAYSLDEAVLIKQAIDMFVKSSVEAKTTPENEVFKENEEKHDKKD